MWELEDHSLERVCLARTKRDFTFLLLLKDNIGVVVFHFEKNRLSDGANISRANGVEGVNLVVFCFLIDS